MEMQDGVILRKYASQQRAKEMLEQAALPARMQAGFSFVQIGSLASSGGKLPGPLNIDGSATYKNEQILLEKRILLY